MLPCVGLGTRVRDSNRFGVVLELVLGLGLVTAFRQCGAKNRGYLIFTI